MTLLFFGLGILDSVKFLNLLLLSVIFRIHFRARHDFLSTHESIWLSCFGLKWLYLLLFLRYTELLKVLAVLNKSNLL